ncbi:MAG: bifunctional protein: zinc-containing alcohol dehydrogenase [Cytophagaceae bacterium]|jgi:NADPH:quinone reductase-like Zn-dependent oxidoreductase|nr:bifunctional protein: zinc-containing alcohol dehydrogenase [Cytophagaceae bacterium]
MKAIVLKDFGGVEHLVKQELPIPAVAADEVLIQVKAISINPVDVKTRAGKGMAGRLKEIKPLILGWDISGIVTEVGDAVLGLKKGDEVFGMVNFPGHGQAYAEYVAAPAAHVALKPSNISHEEAAAATLAALTAWQALVTHANLQPGAYVLIHAASGGVGHYAVQLAKHLGANVTGTSSGSNKDFVLNLGADLHINYKRELLEDVAPHMDFVLDTIGGESIDHSINVTKQGGTVISIPSGLNETVVEKAKAKGVNGYFFLVQSNGQDMQHIAALLEKGILKSTVSKTFSLDQIAEAHLAVESGRTVGKVVVVL